MGMGRLLPPPLLCLHFRDVEPVRMGGGGEGGEMGKIGIGHQRRSSLFPSFPFLAPHLGHFLVKMNMMLEEKKQKTKQQL